MFPKMRKEGQKGVVLALILMLLLIGTILAVTMLSSSTSETRLASARTRETAASSLAEMTAEVLMLAQANQALSASDVIAWNALTPGSLDAAASGLTVGDANAATTPEYQAHTGGLLSTSNLSASEGGYFTLTMHGAGKDDPSSGAYGQAQVRVSLAPLISAVGAVVGAPGREGFAAAAKGTVAQSLAVENGRLLSGGKSKGSGPLALTDLPLPAKSLPGSLWKSYTWNDYAKGFSGAPADQLKDLGCGGDCNYAKEAPDPILKDQVKGVNDAAWGVITSMGTDDQKLQDLQDAVDEATNNTLPKNFDPQVSGIGKSLTTDLLGERYKTLATAYTAYQQAEDENNTIDFNITMLIVESTICPLIKAGQAVAQVAEAAASTATTAAAGTATAGVGAAVGPAITTVLNALPTLDCNLQNLGKALQTLQDFQNNPMKTTLSNAGAKVVEWREDIRGFWGAASADLSPYLDAKQKRAQLDCEPFGIFDSYKGKKDQDFVASGTSPTILHPDGTQSATPYHPDEKQPIFLLGDNGTLAYNLFCQGQTLQVKQDAAQQTAPVQAVATVVHDKDIEYSASVPDSKLIQMILVSGGGVTFTNIPAAKENALLVWADKNVTLEGHVRGAVVAGGDIGGTATLAYSAALNPKLLGPPQGKEKFPVAGFTVAGMQAHAKMQ